MSILYETICSNDARSSAGSASTRAAEFADSLKYDKNGLLVAIAQDIDTGEILMQVDIIEYRDKVAMVVEIAFLAHIVLRWIMDQLLAQFAPAGVCKSGRCGGDS